MKRYCHKMPDAHDGGVTISEYELMSFVWRYNDVYGWVDNSIYYKHGKENTLLWFTGQES